MTSLPSTTFANTSPHAGIAASATTPRYWREHT
jgi:hypothetical protein